VSRDRLGIFKIMGRGRRGHAESRADMAKVRQLSNMVTWLLIKVLNRSCFLIYGGSPTKLDEIIQEKLRDAIRLSLECEDLISWCCNAAEVENVEEDHEAD